MPEKPYKLCYPSLGNYDIAIRYFVNNGLHLDYMSPPAMTKRTIELGAKYSPDFVCAPFKCHMGNYIEALEAGANVLIQTGGTCRLGYYGELHEQILKDMGYDFEIFNISLFRYPHILDILKGIKQLAPDASLLQMARAIPATLKMITNIDRVEDYYRQNMGFEIEKGSYDRVYKRFLADLRKAKGFREVQRIYKQTMADMAAIPHDKPEHPLRVGVVGEYFTIMDPFSNHEVEKKLAQMGAEVHRWMNLSNSLLICPDKNTIRKLKHYVNYDLHKFPSSIWVDIQKEECSNYVRYDTGSSSVSTVTLAEYYAKKGFDGLVHIKSFGCTPEMDCIPILHNISADYKIPTLYMSYDTQTSDTGIETRLEAFYDMIAMGHEKKMPRFTADGGTASPCRHVRERSIPGIKERKISMKKAYLGIDIGSISTKGVIIDEEKNILCGIYLWTEGNPMEASKRVIAALGRELDQTQYQVVAAGTTGSARKLVGAMCNASIVKNEITAHAVGTTTLHPDVRTILEIGGQDSKIICVENGVAVDYAMNTLCAAGTGSFLTSQARRLGVEVEEFGKIALGSQNPTPIAARCTVFAESDLVHKIQMGHQKEDIIAGLCNAVANNYLNNIGKGKKIVAPIVFQGGVSKNEGVVKAFADSLGEEIIVDENGHLMGCYGAAILAQGCGVEKPFSFDVADMNFLTREVTCPNCANHCEIICVYREGELIDAWGNRCERGEVRQGEN